MPKNKSIKILALETSCDETAAAIVENGTKLLSNVVHSQVDLHAVYGGVVPEIASRAHVDICDKVIDLALSEANLALEDLDYLAVTYGPGLVGALLTGVACMKGLSYASKKPLIPVNHIHGHVYANFLSEKKPPTPFVCLIASGGHSHIIIMNTENDYQIIGRTVDDAAGEAFDKAARVLDLPYPGGPKLSELAKTGNPSTLQLPNPKVENKYDFSFSGLKTAFINAVHKKKQSGVEIPKADFAASFENKITDILVQKTIQVALNYGIKAVCIAGGVSANTVLREKIQKACLQNNLSCYLPNLKFCTDNAAMIAAAAYYTLQKGHLADLSLNAIPNLSI